MIISKEILYRQGNVNFSGGKYKEVISQLINLLTDTKKAGSYVTLAVDNQSQYSKKKTLICTVDSRYWDQIKTLYYFIKTTDYTLRFSDINKEGRVYYHYINIDKDNLYNWYYADEYTNLRFRLPFVSKNTSYEDFINTYCKDKKLTFSKYKSWDNKDVFGYLEPTKLNYFISRENPYINSRVSSYICKQNNSDYEYYDISDIKIIVVKDGAILENLDFPDIYYKPRIEETRLNQYINEYLFSLPKEDSDKLNSEIFEYNKPLTAFIDIETNVGAMAEGDLPWDVFNKIVNAMDNRLANEEDLDDAEYDSEDIMKSNVHSDKPKSGYSDKTDDEIDDLLNSDNDTFSSPSDPYQPINTISIAVNKTILVLSRRKYLTKDEKILCQKEIEQHFSEIKPYQESPFKFEFLQFDTEYELIEFFLNKIVKSVTAVTGWNFFGYDWPYIINRYFRILRYWLGYNYSNKNISKMSVAANINKDIQTGLMNLLKYKKYDRISDEDLFEVIMNTLISSDNLSGFIVKNIKTLSGRALQLYLPNNKILYDYLEIYNKWDKSVSIKESLTLDWTAQTILNVPKLPHELGFDEFYAKQFRTYVVYNAIDSILVALLDRVIKTSDIYLSFSTTMMIEPNYALSSVRPVTNVISNFANRKNLVFPRVLNRQKKRRDEEFAGAYVKAPTPGLYKSVIALDYASLYPSTIRTMAISPENLIYQGSRFRPTQEQMKKYPEDPYAAYNEYIDCSVVKDKLEKEYERDVPKNQQIPRDQRVYTPSGAIFKKSVDGLMPSVLTHYYMERKKAKVRMKQALHNLNEVEKALLKRFPNTDYKVEI